MSEKIMGVTVGTSLSPSKIEEKIKPVKTVNGVAPDENGNVEVKADDYTLTEGDKVNIANKALELMEQAEDWEV